MSNYYDPDGNPITSQEWSEMFKDVRLQQVAQDRVTDSEGRDVSISTVWLGLDHSFGHGDPLIFETMIFGGSHDQDMWRYSTRAEAIAGHADAIMLVTYGKRWCNVEIWMEYDPATDEQAIDKFVDTMLDAAHAAEPDGLDVHVSSARNQHPPGWAT